MAYDLQVLKGHDMAQTKEARLDSKDQDCIAASLRPVGSRMREEPGT